MIVAELSSSARQAALRSMAAEELDVLVIGDVSSSLARLTAPEIVPSR